MSTPNPPANDGTSGTRPIVAIAVGGFAMDEIDFVLSNTEPATDMQRRMVAQSRREFNETRRAELEAEALRHRNELRFTALRMAGVEPGSHFAPGRSARNGNGSAVR
ncbi:MAG: hypothetical protein WBH47_01375 [Streptosporangiaceae bacterium]